MRLFKLLKGVNNMACFLVPAAEAVIVTAVTKAAESKKKKAAAEESGVFTEEMTPVSFTKKAKWLRNMLWGGSFLLAFEHVWHGEVVPWFPFLSAAANPVDAAEMLQEMATAGVSMAVLVTAVWGFMLAGAHVIQKRALSKGRL